MRRLRTIQPQELRIPTGLSIAMLIVGAIGVAIGVVPTFMGDEADGRRDVATFLAGAVALGFAVVVFVRLGLETALQRAGAAPALSGAPSDPDPEVLQLVGVDLREAFLPEADLTRVELSDALLDDADLSLAALRRSSLAGAKLRRADLRSADLSWADLRGADLQRADLRRANLAGADLRGTSLRDASLDQVKLRGARYDETTSWPAEFSPLESGAVEARKGRPSST